MFRKILIANRGEIACRVIRTARRMGIATVAVYSDADRHALHVEMADEAYPIGPAPSRQSYLDGARIIAAARASGADAIHPGYGFLSENADFAQACADANLVFIGPPPSAIRAMGSKSAAKALMGTAGVPLVPGYHGDAQEPDLLAREAARIGFPVLIKASAGGGGKGMRVVERQADFAEQLAAAQGEALASFGDDHVLLERYLTRPRHIEIQVFADRHGNVVHLFERDCSIQRRHQKVLEEAPAPGMTAERRAEMGRAACDAARAIGYEGAGTVEFIVDAGIASEIDAGIASATVDQRFFFMEMNTRLQVEHPVTEMITGQDLVEWQLRVAAGEPLPLPQDALSIDGHAIEARIYAEDPARDYLPSTGRLFHLRQPAAGPGVRIDAGVRQGDAITVHYDPMIAKLIAWGPTRETAVQRLRDALAGFEVGGVRTNLDLLRAIAADADFAAAALDTGFLPRHPDLALASPGPSAAIAAAAAAFLGRHARAARDAAAARGDEHSPWATAQAWRLNGTGELAMQLLHDGATLDLLLHPNPDASFALEHDGAATLIAHDEGSILMDGVRQRVASAISGEDVWVFGGDGTFVFTLVDQLAPPIDSSAAEQRLLAPMPGRIVSVQAEVGAAVNKGDILVVLEAMKVQMRLAAPRDGVIATVRAQAGDLVEEGVELVGFEE